MKMVLQAIQSGYLLIAPCKNLGSRTRLVELLHRQNKIINLFSMRTVRPLPTISYAVYLLIQPDRAGLGNASFGAPPHAVP